MNRHGKWLPLCALTLLLSMVLQDVHAQQERSLEIREGRVYLDGQLLEADRLPASLDVRGTEALFRFVGEERPVVSFGGRLYRLEQAHLEEVGVLPTGENPVTVFFREGRRPPFAAPGQASRALFDGPAPPASPGAVGRASIARQAAALEKEAAALEAQAQVLEEESQQLDELNVEIAAQHGQGLDATAQQLNQRAQELVQVAQQLPRIEVQSYLDDIRQQNFELYERLVREQTLELETHELAARIRALPAQNAERTALKRTLRARLEEIFALKQQNRRREIAQLEAELHALRQRLQDREQLHQRLIDQRLQELTGDPAADH